MLKTRMTFGEVLESARRAGFEISDARGLRVGRELQPMIEDANLMAEDVRVELQPATGGSSTGIVARLLVRDQAFQLHGEFSRVSELEQLLGGAVASPRSSPLGEPPER